MGWPITELTPPMLPLNRLNDHVNRRIVRARPRRRTNGLGCLVGCAGALVVTALVVVVFMLPLFPGWVAQAAGLAPQGATRDIFDDEPAPTPVTLQAAQPATQVSVVLPNAATYTVSGAMSGAQVQIGTDALGARVVTAEFTEDAVNALCRQYTTVCAANGGRIQNARIDLQPGGAIIYADVSAPELGGLSGRVGLVVHTDGRWIALAGVDINGTLYSLPDTVFGIDVRSIEAQINAAIHDSQLSTEYGTFRISGYSITSDHVIVTLN